MTDSPYHNQASQAERKAIVENDSYCARQKNEIAEGGGRYSKLRPTTIADGSTSSIPEQPANSPWHHDPVPAEEPLGFSVDEMQPVGEPFEVEQSLTRKED